MGITGVHTLLYSAEAEAVRTMLIDVWDSVTLTMAKTRGG